MNVLYLYPGILYDLMNDVDNFKSLHTFYLFGLGVQANDANYIRHEVNLELSRPETEIILESNFANGTTVLSTQDLYLIASWHDPYYSSSSTYSMSWECSGNSLFCTRMSK